MEYSKQKLTEEKVFKDPVHRYVHVRDKVIWDLIATKEFQRLRRIRQLGTTYFTFHGAEHSRFNHSLGVYEIIRRIIDDVFDGRPEWDPEDRLLTLCAALLHDLGHGPFSHSFEKVFHLDHEEFTQDIIVGDTEVNAILSKVNADFPTKVAEVIAKTYENKLIVSLISSQLDADRMDYLLRDAYFTGVSYGNFDMERLLRVMRPKEDQVVFKYSGMHAVEDYILSRYQMYWQVYFHPVTRSAEVILTKILHRAKELHDEYYSFKHHPIHFYSLFEDELTLEDYLKLDEHIILYYFQMWQEEEDKILSDLCTRFVNRSLFKYVDFDPAKQFKVHSQLETLFKQVGIDPNYYLVVDSSSDLPYDFYRPGEEEERLPIHLLKKSGEIRELSRESDIVDAISGKRRTDHKLYYPADLIQDDTTNSEMKQKIRSILESL
ncbi:MULTISPECIES: HD domain-containing protein [Heyndrickxia]|jgi:HD superfamily phosphohydrolase|uniref:HD domain-containing protein n=1 Tax=Heyndrickxia oleronia TaxID=38875 RepID=A0A8E2IAP3_9BACI|nr:HD domain-containing protein [Heyndrickxia oleronia]NYV65817.1 HD domain-containing protein [Bacillus sp. Gen3]MBU5211249.1 HD domain-containing protein [Heyndrickxia oleronia]MCI1589358.1 HD domain-containing protein [Heyndrickxia oleronia]MCI1612351.1 HD domain-containing protein [Heyndrickxia oleronia]MCI1743687.1 HD domain-containing protein [Heyndrickxia oleronia]